MNKEKLFTKPECLVIEFLNEEIIVTSGEFDFGSPVDGESTPEKP